MQEKELPDEHIRALGQLADMPQWLALKDGSLVDLVTGMQVSCYQCSEGAPHLALYHGKQRLVAFLTPASLRKYLAVQEAVARQLAPVV